MPERASLRHPDERRRKIAGVAGEQRRDPPAAVSLAGADDGGKDRPHEAKLVDVEPQGLAVAARAAALARSTIAEIVEDRRGRHREESAYAIIRWSRACSIAFRLATSSGSTSKRRCADLRGGASMRYSRSAMSSRSHNSVAVAWRPSRPARPISW